MTSEPTTGLCCKHGAKLDRAVELLEDLHAARAGKKCAICEGRKRDQKELTEQWKQEFLERHGRAAPVSEEAESVDDQPKPKWGRWKRAALIALGVIAFAALAAGGFALHIAFIRWAA